MRRKIIINDYASIRVLPKYGSWTNTTSSGITVAFACNMEAFGSPEFVKACAEAGVDPKAGGAGEAIVRSYTDEALEQLPEEARAYLKRREDVVTDGNQQDKVLANAPDAREGFFAVPKVVE